MTTQRTLMLLFAMIALSGCNAFERDTMELPPAPQGNIVATSSSTPQERRLEELQDDEDDETF